VTAAPYALVAAPTNLGLRPPAAGAVPGTAKAPEALREARLHERLREQGVVEYGVVLPGRYLDDAYPGVPRLRNQELIVAHALTLADRLHSIHAADRRPVVLGGDCSLLVGAGVALRRRGRFGLIHIDGHTDFRHPGNSDLCASLAGEDLAAAIGLHWPAVSDIDGLRPYFRPEDSVHVGCRADDEHLVEARETLGDVVLASQIRDDPDGAMKRVRRIVDRADLDGFWVHLDVDVLDPAVMPAVDSPSPGGIDFTQLGHLLTVLPDSAGLQVCVFDPDLDADGSYAAALADTLVAALSA
jgi:arginase